MSSPICLECHEQFVQKKYKKAKFCSQRCANASKIRNFIDRAPRTEKQCEYCYKKFYVLSCKLRDKNKKYRFCCRECFYNSRKIIPRKCSFCSKDFNPSNKKQVFCSNRCRGKSVIGIQKTGFWYENGYKVLYNGDGKGIKEHIKIMQDHIGRSLAPNEIVHHTNHIRDDNRLENLQLMDKKEHIRLHRKLDKENGKDFFGGKRPWQTTEDL